MCFEEILRRLEERPASEPSLLPESTIEESSSETFSSSKLGGSIVIAMAP